MVPLTKHQYDVVLSIDAVAQTHGPFAGTGIVYEHRRSRMPLSFIDREQIFFEYFWLRYLLSQLVFLLILF